MSVRINSLLVLFLATLLFVFIAPNSVKAAVSCSGSFATSPLSANASTDVTISATNSGETDIRFIKFSRSAGDFTFTAGSGSGWVANPSDDAYYFTEGTISAGGSGSFSFTLNVAAQDDTTGRIEILAAESEFGDDEAVCASVEFSISNTAANSISGVTVSASPTAATLTWTSTLSSNSIVYYGQTTAYGSTATGDTATTSHSVSLSGLVESTTYHFKVRSEPTSGTAAESSDANFKTGAAGTTTTTITTTTTSTTTAAAVVVKDTTPPSVTITTKYDKALKEAGEIVGRVTDGKMVKSIDYSIDNGKNWLPVDETKGLDTKSATFSFIPIIFEDGDYKIKVRAKDDSGNVGYSRVLNATIDRLPPLVGGTLISLGPQVLKPTTKGFFAVVGLEEKITLSAVGGANKIDIVAEDLTFPLTKNPENGLWSGSLVFTTSGTFNLVAYAEDGAANKTERSLGKVLVLPAGKITGDGLTAEAQIKVWYFDEKSKKFVLWDGAPYGQDNPVNTQAQEYRLYLPSGKYYLEVYSPGYKKIKTNIFTIEQSTPILDSFTLSRAPGIKIGPIDIPLPGFGSEYVQISAEAPDFGSEVASSLVGKEMFGFNLLSNGVEISDGSIKGKPTVVTFLNTWVPSSFEQITFLEGLVAEEKQITALVIIPQESVSYIDIFAKRGKYTVPIVSDPDGVLVTPFDLQTLPTHVFLTRKGIVKAVVSGVLTKDEMLKNLID